MRGKVKNISRKMMQEILYDITNGLYTEEEVGYDGKAYKTYEDEENEDEIDVMVQMRYYDSHYSADIDVTIIDQWGEKSPLDNDQRLILLKELEEMARWKYEQDKDYEDMHDYLWSCCVFQ